MLFQLVGQHWSMMPKEVQGILLSVSLVPCWKMYSWEDLIQLLSGRADPILSSNAAPSLGPALLGSRVPEVAAEVLGWHKGRLSTGELSSCPGISAGQGWADPVG